MCSTGFDARTSVQTLLGIIVTEAPVSSSISTVFPSIATGTMKALHFSRESKTVNMGQWLPFTNCSGSRSSSTKRTFCCFFFFPNFDFGVHFSSHFPRSLLFPRFLRKLLHNMNNLLTTMALGIPKETRVRRVIDFSTTKALGKRNSHSLFHTSSMQCGGFLFGQFSSTCLFESRL